jgi:hypothetical protein
MARERHEFIGWRRLERSAGVRGLCTAGAGSHRAKCARDDTDPTYSWNTRPARPVLQLQVLILWAQFFQLHSVGRVPRGPPYSYADELWRSARHWHVRGRTRAARGLSAKYSVQDHPARDDRALPSVTTLTLPYS